MHSYERLLSPSSYLLVFLQTMIFISVYKNDRVNDFEVASSLRQALYNSEPVNLFFLLKSHGLFWERQNLGHTFLKGTEFRSCGKFSADGIQIIRAAKIDKEKRSQCIAETADHLWIKRAMPVDSGRAQFCNVSGLTRAGRCSLC